MVLNEVFVEAHVFVFGEDRVISFETIFFEHGFISDGWYRLISAELCGMEEGGIGRVVYPFPWISAWDM